MEVSDELQTIRSVDVNSRCLPKWHDVERHLAQDQICRDFSRFKMVSGVF